MEATLDHWNGLDYERLVLHLKELADEKYRVFHSRLVPNHENILGVRLPFMKKLAKEIAKGNWNEYLLIAGCEFYEEVMLKGLVIGLIKTDFKSLITIISRFIPQIDNWAVCDSFCAGLKATKLNMNLMLEYLMGLALSQSEYTLRFVSVMLLDFYINDDYIDTVLQLYEHISHDGYYVKMAVAWGLSVCLVKYYDKTVSFLKTAQIDMFTYNKALQKATESNRISDENKQFLRQMKK